MWPIRMSVDLELGRRLHREFTMFYSGAYNTLVHRVGNNMGQLWDILGTKYQS